MPDEYPPLDSFIEKLEHLPNVGRMIQRLKALSASLYKMKSDNSDHRNAFITVSHHVEKLDKDISSMVVATLAVEWQIQRLRSYLIAERLANNTVKLMRLGQSSSLMKILLNRPKLDQTNYQDRQEELQTNKDGHTKGQIEGLPPILTPDQLGISQNSRGTA